MQSLETIYISELSQCVMISDKALNIGRLRCPVEYLREELFFSLVDYRNNYFTSDDPNKIIEFYNGFENRDQLIQWMRERPKGTANIHEVEGDKDIIAVIPTSDFNGKYVKECRDNIFKGIHMVFVESGGRGDFYFNIAHNINVGIKKAMEYNPKWGVFSNDDVVKVDEIAVLKRGLNNLDNEKIGLVYAYPPGDYHSLKNAVVKPRFIRSLIHIVLQRLNKDLPYVIRKRFNVTYMLVPDIIISRILHKYMYKFVDTVAFGIYSAKLLDDLVKNNNYIFDCNYINCHEESDLAIRTNNSKWGISTLIYKIKPLIGESLGRTNGRTLRDQASAVYFSKKFGELCKSLRGREDD